LNIVLKIFWKTFSKEGLLVVMMSFNDVMTILTITVVKKDNDDCFNHHRH